MSEPLQGASNLGQIGSYLAVGHVVIDALENGERRPGGTALYAAVQAARLGLSATIVTRGVPIEIEEALAPWAGEVELIVQPAEETTTLGTSGAGTERRQRMVAWAGPLALDALPAAAILHLAPVAAELRGPAPGPWRFVGVTPQGLARRWLGQGAEITPCEPDPNQALIGGRCDAIVLSQQERPCCASLLERGRREGALIAVTAGPGAVELVEPDGTSTRLPAYAVEQPVDDLGAGDVYAAAFFTSLAAGDGAVQAARFAHAAAALRLGAVGPEAIATLAEIEVRQELDR